MKTMTATSSAPARKPVCKPKRRRSRKYSGAPLVMVMPSVEDMGPAMRALTPKQRRFVLELARGPVGYGSGVRAARASYGTPTSSSRAMRVQAHRAIHNPKIQEALREVGGRIIRAEAFEAIHTTAAIARDRRHKD